LRLPNWPATTEQLRTTSASIYLGNLDARITQLEGADHRAAAVAQALASSLLHRYRILGRWPDVERAGALLQAALQTAPESASLQLEWAGWLLLVHRFADAEAALARVQGLRSNGAVVDGARLENLQEELALATGQYERLGEDFREPARQAPAEFYALAERAYAALLHGDLDLASRLYFEAQHHYRDVGPYPLAWLHVQQGIALLRHGHCAAAEPFFRAAHERLPGYALATEHLAECLLEARQGDEARALYESVIAQTDNPEYIAALARLEEADERPERAALLRLQADERWAAWLAAWPQAHAQHAARYYLDTGRLDQARALAEQNLQWRQDIDSRLLMMDVATEQGDSATVCAQWQRVQSTGLNAPEVVTWRERTRSCPAH
ncbi:MAG: tetratricopeptide repeat protein, partial [Xanthomonadales bacterium]|nr:tetratricopeptide repeat protein [Xanthomonadales bacterium]